jgi:hypothetical protein
MEQRIVEPVGYRSTDTSACPRPARRETVGLGMVKNARDAARQTQNALKRQDMPAQDCSSYSENAEK